MAMQGQQAILQLRGTFDKKKQSSSIQEKQTSRKGYLKDILVQKFIQKNQLETGVGLHNQDGTPVNETKLIRLHVIVNKEFDRFIEQQTFTQKNLMIFEIDLKNKLEDILSKEGIKIDKLATSKTTRNTNVLVSRDYEDNRMSKKLSLPKIETKYRGSIPNDQYASQKLQRNFSQNPTFPTSRHSMNLRKSSNNLPERNYQSLGKNINRSVQQMETLQKKYDRALTNSVTTPMLNDQNLKMLQNNEVINSYSNQPMPKFSDFQQIQIKEDKAYADIRVKMGNKKSPENFYETESIPSEISEDMWGELPRFKDYQHQQQMKKEKEDHQKKLQKVRQTLDQQISDQKVEKQQKMNYVKQMDDLILTKAHQELEMEKKKKEDMKEKIFRQKQMQDEMLVKAQEQKKMNFQAQRQNELKEVADLQQAIKQEKQDKIEKKKREREVAWKIIRENELEKEKRMQEKELEKERAVQLMIENEKRLDEVAQKRREEMEKREKKIKDAMGRMADTVLRKNNEAEKEMERIAVKYAMEKDKREELKEKEKKQAMRQRDIEIKRTLDQQIMEKNKMKEHEMEKNKKYIQMVLDQDENYKKNLLEKNQKDLQKRKEYQKFQKLQMGDLTNENGDPSVLSSINKKVRGKKAQLGGPMQLEEIRMNKNLLKEINKMKKDQTQKSSPSRGLDTEFNEIQNQINHENNENNLIYS